MTTFSISREPDDPVPEILRASIGGGEPPNFPGFYLVFRGDPAAVVSMLQAVTAEAERALPAGDYKDTRGRPQG